MYRYLLAGVAGVLMVTPPTEAAARTLTGSAFTFQGQLKQAGVPVHEPADLRFTLWTESTNGSVVAGPVTISQVGVVHGLLSVELDFGPDAFSGDGRWLEIAASVPAGGGTFVTLTPRQRVTPAPVALSLPGLSTVQNPTSPNLIGGHQGNTTATGAVGATIGGGGAEPSRNRVFDNYGTIAGGRGNTAGTDNGHVADATNTTVGGGSGNRAAGPDATVAGGLTNVATGAASTIGGGSANAVPGDRAVIGGGSGNTADAAKAGVLGGSGNVAGGEGAAVGGGQDNTANGPYAAVPGGYGNSASGDYALAAGRGANAAHGGAFVWADSTAGTFASSGSNQFLIRAAGGVGIGTADPQTALHVHGDITTDAVRLSAPQTRYYAITGLVFQPWQDGVPYDKAPEAYLTGVDAGETMVFFAPVLLPNGATITRFEAQIYDEDTTEDIAIRLYSWGGPGRTSHGLAASTGSDTGVRTVAKDITPGLVVDNASRAYYVETRWVVPDADARAIRLYRVLIDYTVTTPLP